LATPLLLIYHPSITTSVAIAPELYR
jgi:hypothetical protein